MQPSWMYYRIYTSNVSAKQQNRGFGICEKVSFERNTIIWVMIIYNDKTSLIKQFSGFLPDTIEILATPPLNEFFLADGCKCKINY